MQRETAVQQAAVYPTLSVALFPKDSIARRVLLVTGAVVFLALCSQVSWNLPFSHAKDGHIVPVTGQTFAVLLIGALLGSRLAGAAVFSYMAAGVAGAPVFAHTDRYYTAFAGPSGGYIIGFFFAAVLVGWFAERGWDRNRWIVLPMLLGNALIYVPGLIWLNAWLHITHVPGATWSLTRDLGLWPFVAGDLAKLVAATLAVPAGWSLAERLRSGQI
jgi:biotin transport system substrate-specific component